MYDINRLIWAKVLIIFISFLAITLKAHAIENQSEWDAAFRLCFRDAEPMLEISNGNDEGNFSWQAHYWIRTYVSMAQTYGDSAYMDKAVKLIDFIFDNVDPARSARGEFSLLKTPYFSAPLYFHNHRDQAAPGWRI